MICIEAIPLMHGYLDGDLTEIHALALKRHLLSCPDCKKHYRQLENTVALVKNSLRQSKAPIGLTDQIMRCIPEQPKRILWMHWVKRHPAVPVALIFMTIMITSLLSLWNHGTELVVKGSDLSQVVIKGHTVYVPAGRKVDGNLMVEHGKIQVDGEVRGNLVVIDGSLALASSAHIAGEITRVNQALEWLWYKMHEVFVTVSQ